MENYGSILESSNMRQALIIGGSVAGLLTARVLSDYYEQILIVERDLLSDINKEAIKSRAGTPQAFHLHILLPAAKIMIERLFPGLTKDLRADGAYAVEETTFVRINSQQGVVRSPQIGEDRNIASSRALLEWEIRQRVQALPGVRFITNQQVVGLQMASDYDRITGVTLRERGQVDQLTTIGADLVVDASGYSSQLTQWLQELGFAVPASEQIHTLVGYSTRLYKASKEVIANVGSMLIDEIPEEGRVGLTTQPIENDMLWVTTFGTGGNYPATDTEGFNREAANLYLIKDQIANELKKAEPLTEPRSYRKLASVRHHYERMERWPAGLLVLGDAFCHFDPLYAQGIGVAAKEAATLANLLQEQKRNPQPGFERRMLQLMQEAIAPAWWLNTVSDLRNPKITYEGDELPREIPLINYYMRLYFQYAHDHPVEPGQVPNSHVPTLANFSLVRGLIASPEIIFNASALAVLLEAEAQQDGTRPLQKLVDATEIAPDVIMETLLPNFPSTYNVFAGMGD